VDKISLIFLPNVEVHFVNNSAFPTTLFYFFPFLFIGMWLLVTTVLSFLSEWFWLCREFPDTVERGRILGSYRASLRGWELGSIRGEY
jgi:hypothetical protein